LKSDGLDQVITSCARFEREEFMLQKFLRRTTLGVMAAVAAVCIPLSAESATINIILSDVDVTYFGDAAGNMGSIYDTIAHPGGNLNPAEADGIETAVFELDLGEVGTLTRTDDGELSGDLKIDGVGATLPLGSLQTGVGSNGGGFGFDFFTEAGDRLRLGIDEVDVLLTNGVFFFTGSATVIDQDLPFGLVFDTTQPVQFSYTATLPVLNGGPTVDRALASGALTISGTQVPEPATLLLLVAGATAVVCGRRYTIR
jgi:hypothetical protein